MRIFLFLALVLTDERLNRPNWLAVLLPGILLLTSWVGQGVQRIWCQ